MIILYLCKPTLPRHQTGDEALAHVWNGEPLLNGARPVRTKRMLELSWCGSRCKVIDMDRPRNTYEAAFWLASFLAIGYMLGLSLIA
jgi:hypothetical protein